MPRFWRLRGVQPDRHPDLGAVVHHVRAGRHDADHFARHAVHLDPWPTTVRPPNAFCHSSCDSMHDRRQREAADPGAGGGPVMFVFAMPRRAALAPAARQARQQTSSTDAERTRSGRSPAVRFTSPVVKAPTAAERLVDLAELEVLRRRHPELLEAEPGKLRRQVHQLFGLADNRVDAG